MENSIYIILFFSGVNAYKYITYKDLFYFNKLTFIKSDAFCFIIIENVLSLEKKTISLINKS